MDKFFLNLADYSVKINNIRNIANAKKFIIFVTQSTGLKRENVRTPNV